MSLRTRRVVLVAGVVGALVLAAPAASGYQNPYGGAGDDDHRAVDLLHHAALAMRATPYSGTRMLSAWGRHGATTVLLDVEHVPGQGTRLSARGGTLAPDTGMFLAGGHRHPTQAGQLTADAVDLMTDAYAVTLGGRDSVAGRAGTVVEASRAGSVVARLWVDDRSGLLLRREVFDLSGRLVRESVFIDLDIAAAGFMAHLPPTSPTPAGQDVGIGHRGGLEAVGWDCPRQAGAMQLVDIEVLGRPGALHMTYSDGLSKMSVFEQRGSLDADSVRGFVPLRVGGRVVHVREGMPTYAMWEDDGLVFTAVTDGPLDALAAVVARRSAHPADGIGFWDRVAVGLARLGGWATPLV